MCVVLIISKLGAAKICGGKVYTPIYRRQNIKSPQPVDE
jgi:hypothetical protein